MKVRILGCGNSSGVPSIHRGWGSCNPSNPKNRRTRSSILLQENGFNLLVDTPPESREQLVAAGIPMIQNVLFTHAHADHIMGADDLRGYSLLTFSASYPFSMRISFNLSQASMPAAS